MSETKTEIIKFGFIPKENEHHFLVVIPKSKDKNIEIYERFYWHTNTKKQVIDPIKDRLKAELRRNHWDLINKELESEFKNRLKEKNLPTSQANWTIGDNPVDRLLGKELLLLVWAIEDCEAAVIDTAMKNWKGLDIAERWWLYTTTNAVTGGADDRRGWRRAIKYALSENPTEENQVARLEFDDDSEIITSESKTEIIKFGFIPKENEHHFLVVVPTKFQNKNIKIYERFKWQFDTKKQVIDTTKDRIKAEISKSHWDLIKDVLESEFKNRLKEKKLSYGQANWITGDNPVDSLLGKELLLLVWAIEDCETRAIDTAIKSWKVLDIAERWWLYTMTNAATGGADDRRGWRKAIKYALSENPVEEVQESQIDWFRM
ncbi:MULTISPECIES: DUF3780 domain-containing protein [unclassified Clostridioides]|uniref:DUF3780 domain-containing protein n=1 Tax=unclassified Clostridioides TaxID=2635829 RepID=UPI001D10245A